MITPITIETRRVGPGQPTMVIAEIGVNHDGSVQRAIDLVRIAATCGADAVKLAVFARPIFFMFPVSWLNISVVEATENPVDMLRKYELSTPDLRSIVKEIRANNMIPLATPFSPPDVEVLESLRIPAIKIASPDIVNRPLLQCAAKLRKPLLISTGAAEMEEIETTVDWLKKWNATFALLHCVSAYPAPAADANLCWIQELAARFNVPVGYSDHTMESLCGALSVAAGAGFVERHLTYDLSARGPDHAASSDPSQFQRYIKHIREADILRGVGEKHVLDIEVDVRKVSRQSLVARRTLEAGTLLTEDDVTVQRPGTGLPASHIERAVGRKILKAVPAGTILQWDMLDAA